jgi:hypothetical protein
MSMGVAELAGWLAEHDVSTAVMESTGVYWKPVYYGLEGLVGELWLVNAAHVKRVPGRKTDLSDAEWLADVAGHGMVRPSFVPPPPIRELRELTRYRKTQSDARAAEIQRLEKVLQDAGIKLTSVASRILTQSGRAMIEALIAGERDGARLAELAIGTDAEARAGVDRALADACSSSSAEARAVSTETLALIGFDTLAGRRDCLVHFCPVPAEPPYDLLDNFGDSVVVEAQLAQPPEERPGRRRDRYPPTQLLESPLECVGLVGDLYDAVATLAVRPARHLGDHRSRSRRLEPLGHFGADGRHERRLPGRRRHRVVGRAAGSPEGVLLAVDGRPRGRRRRRALRQSTDSHPLLPASARRSTIVW